MRQLKSVNQYGITEGFGFSIFLFCFGLVFIVMFLPQLVRDIAVRGSFDSFTFGALVAVAFGLMIAWGGFVQANLARKLGEVTATIQETNIQPGDSFHFVFSQQCHQRISTKNIGVFLVFREIIDYHDGSEGQRKYVDRLVQAFTHAGQTYSAGEVIHLDHTFTIPNRPMGIRNSFMKRKEAKVETLWAVKVLIDLGRSYTIWQEYGVEVDNVEAEKSVTNSARKDETPRFDVILTGCQFFAPFRVMSTTSKLLPHLRSGQIGDINIAMPCLILERVTETEAKAAQEQIAAAGGFAKIQRSEPA